MTRWTDWVVIGVVVFQALIAAVINSPPGDLGIPDVAVKWLVVLNVGFVVFVNQVKALGAERVPPKDPQPPIGEGPPKPRRTTTRKES